MKSQVAISLIFLVFAIPALARELSILFIGNSYTYLPGIGEPNDPALPKIIRQMAESIDSDLVINYDFNTPGGYNFERHYRDPTSIKLLSKTYDKVILQGQSIESLELTPWWEQNGNFGVKSFSIYLPRILNLVLKSNSDITFYVNWGWNFKNPLLEGTHPGLRFPIDHERYGEKWCGEDKFEYQDTIDSSYQLHARNFPVTMAKIGRAWILLQEASLVSEDQLYLPDDWSHPSPLGAFVTALMLTRDALQLDIAKNKFIPADVDPANARTIQAFLSIPAF